MARSLANSVCIQITAAVFAVAGGVVPVDGFAEISTCTSGRCGGTVSGFQIAGPTFGQRSTSGFGGVATAGASSNCRLIGDGNSMQCSDGLWLRGGDGVYRKADNGILGVSAPANGLNPGVIAGSQSSESFVSTSISAEQGDRFTQSVFEDAMAAPSPIGSSGAHQTSAPTAAPTRGAKRAVAPASPQPDLKPLNKPSGPFFRYGFNGDNWEEGRCSGTGIQTPPGVTLPEGYCHVAVTAAHCLEDGMRDAFASQLVGDGVSKSCRSDESVGFSMRLRTSLGGPGVEAIAIVPKEGLTDRTGSDLGMFLLPCDGPFGSMQKFKPVENLQAGGAAVHGYFPVSRPGMGPVALQSRTDMIPTAGKLDFVGHGGINGDSGSPFFVHDGGEWKVACVLTGAVAGGLGAGGSLGTCGLQTETSGPGRAQTNLARGIRSLVSGLSCGTKADSVASCPR